MYNKNIWNKNMLSKEIKAIVRPDMEKWSGSKLGKEYVKAVILLV